MCLSWQKLVSQALVLPYGVGLYMCLLDTTEVAAITRRTHAIGQSVWIDTIRSKRDISLFIMYFQPRLNVLIR